MSLSIGIVGLPNVGKSTLFTALTKQGGLAANYPFATIDPNVGVVDVPDSRLQALADIVHPGRIVPATVEFVDIAGLVKGASEGEGLGNQFLANIRETDAICEVVRFFKDPDVVHVAGRVDPLGDVDTIHTELILADLATIERAMPKVQKESHRGDKRSVTKLATMERLQAWMNEGHRARTMEMTDEERESISDLFLLTMKPVLYVANVDEDGLTAELPLIDGIKPIPICRARARRGQGVPRKPGPRGERSCRARPGRLQPTGPAVLFHRRRDGGQGVDDPDWGNGSQGRRRDSRRL